MSTERIRERESERGDSEREREREQKKRARERDRNSERERERETCTRGADLLGDIHAQGLSEHSADNQRDRQIRF